MVNVKGMPSACKREAALQSAGEAQGVCHQRLEGAGADRVLGSRAESVQVSEREYWLRGSPLVQAPWWRQEGFRTQEGCC